MLFCKWRGGAKACRLTPCKQVTLKIRARVRDDCANTGQAAGATGYSSGTPVAQCQRHKDRTIEAVLSSGCLQVFCGNEKTPGATRYPCPLLRSLSLSLEAGVPHGTLNFLHGLLVNLPRTHPAARLAVGGSALATLHPLPLSLYSTPRVVGVATAAAAAGAAAADAQHRPRLVLLRQWANSHLLWSCWVQGSSAPLAETPRRW